MVILLAVVLYLVVYGFPFMAATPGLRYPRSFQLNQAAFAISNGVPAGGAFGLGVQYAMLASWSVPATTSTAAIGAVGVWSIFVTLGLPVFGLLAIWASGALDPGPYVYIGLLGFAVLVAMIVVFALVMRSESLAERIGRIADKLARPFMHRFMKGREPDFVPTVLQFRSDTVDLVRNRWGRITVAQVSVSLTQFLILFAALRGVEGDDSAKTPFLVVFGAYAVAQIGIMIPITPGGLGTVDAFMISLLTAMGVSAGDATAATLVWRAASFVPQIAIGVVCLVMWSRTAARTFAAAPRHPPDRSIERTRSGAAGGDRERVDDRRHLRGDRLDPDGELLDARHRGERRDRLLHRRHLRLDRRLLLGREALGGGQQVGDVGLHRGEVGLGLAEVERLHVVDHGLERRLQARPCVADLLLGGLGRRGRRARAGGDAQSKRESDRRDP